MAYLADLGITLAVELPVVCAVAWAAGARGRDPVVAGLLANMLTHPLLWFVVAPGLHDLWGRAGVVVAEVLVVAVEAAVYRARLHGLGVALCAWLSVLANALSWGVGLLVHHGLP